jgi:hypothetical protein
MTSQWQPHREPLRITLLRTVTLAAILGALIARVRGGLGWPMWTLVMLWPTFGGHWVELWFLNWVRPRLGDSRALHVVARLGVWFVGGVGLGLGMYLTAKALPGFRPRSNPPWWLGGLAFIGLELVVQLALQLRGRPSFYNGRG